MLDRFLDLIKAARRPRYRSSGAVVTSGSRLNVQFFTNGGVTPIRRDREKPGAERAAKLIMVYYVPPKRCHGGIPPWTPKQKQSSLGPGFSWSPNRLK